MKRCDKISKDPNWSNNERILQADYMNPYGIWYTYEYSHGSTAEIRSTKKGVPWQGKPSGWPEKISSSLQRHCSVMSLGGGVPSGK